MTAAQIVSHIFNEYDSPEWDQRIANDYDLDSMLFEVEEFAVDDEELMQAAKIMLAARYSARCN